MALTKADTAYRHKVIVPRYLAGEKAELLAKDLGITESAMRSWFHREHIYRFGPKKQGPNLQLSPWARRAFSPCARAIAELEALGITRDVEIADLLHYSEGTIRTIRNAMRYVERLGKA